MAFPDFGPIPENISYTVNGYGQGWMMFQMFAGFMDAKAPYYLALCCALIGGMMMFYDKKNHNLKTALSWLFCVMVILVAPYNSNLFFYDLGGSKDGKTTTSINMDGITELQKARVESSIATQVTGGADTNKQNPGALKAFTPQLAATHVMSLLHRAIFASLYTTGYDGKIRVRNYIDDVANATQFGNMESARISNNNIGYELAVFKSLCGSTGLLVKEPLPQGKASETYLRHKGFFEGLVLTQKEHERLRGTMFTAGSVLDLTKAYYTDLEDRNKKGMMPPVPIIYTNDRLKKAAEASGKTVNDIETLIFYNQKAIDEELPKIDAASAFDPTSKVGRFGYGITEDEAAVDSAADAADDYGQD